MNSFSGWEEIAAALAGAAAAGIFSVFDRRRERTRKRHATLSAITSEVSAISSLIREQGYQNDLSQLAAEVVDGTWNDEVQTIDARMNYMFVYESLAVSLGELEAKHIEPIVEFYQRVRAFVDSTRPDGILAEGGTPSERKDHVLAVNANVKKMLDLGDRIVQFVER